MGGSPALEVLRNAPVIGVDPFDDAGATQGFEPAHMGFDKALGITTRTKPFETSLFEMPARSIDSALH